jgi:ADP-L-glycero-D-manno-heptose 6-epimerase
MSALKNDVYNVGTATPRSFQDIADILQTQLGKKIESEYFENPHSAYQTYTKADIESTKEFLNFSPRFSLEDGIKAYLPEIKLVYEKEVRGG